MKAPMLGSSRSCHRKKAARALRLGQNGGGGIFEQPWGGKTRKKFSPRPAMALLTLSGVAEWTLSYAKHWSDILRAPPSAAAMAHRKCWRAGAWKRCKTL